MKAMENLVIPSQVCTYTDALYHQVHILVAFGAAIHL